MPSLRKNARRSSPAQLAAGRTARSRSRLVIGAKALELSLDPVASAKAASCRYVDDRVPGIRRLKHGKGFRYVAPDGKAVKDGETLSRIRALVIPPAWTNVWICTNPDGHIQATGRDARGRKQYRYHARFRALREETKFAKLVELAECLPKIRAKVDEDLGLTGLARDKVLATIVRLLEITLIRVGNEEYARENDSFGLTTLRTRHVDVEGSKIRFHFRGKSGKEHELAVTDRRVARVIARCNDLPGEVLFQYVDDDGQNRIVESSEVNEYLRSITELPFTAKDFRTWAATVLAAEALFGAEPCTSETAFKRSVTAVVKNVSTKLGNTPAVCRKCYVHPDIWTAHKDNTLRDLARRPRAADPALSYAEACVLELLRAARKRGPISPALAPVAAAAARAS